MFSDSSLEDAASRAGFETEPSLPATATTDRRGVSLLELEDLAGGAPRGAAGPAEEARETAPPPGTFWSFGGPAPAGPRRERPWPHGRVDDGRP